MFKVESYITPIILSYVDKYIKNFRPEDSQVSLWGGDASFHNLDLRLEVIEQELQLPFSFVSGHIHELLIHVPWTKIASEPITITINTIECILKLHSEENGRGGEKPVKEKPKKTPHHKQSMEAPPGYIQLLINKIVSNIRINCNNLILKYVEEDIVLSMNVKLLTVESANENWTPAYTEVYPTQVILRKIISVNDLTVCLDKRNASGKIDVYQEPMLYRCSMILHFFRSYHNVSSKKCSTTRLDISCSSMEFSMTEQQIPMLLRLLYLLHALQQKQLKSDVDLNKDNEAPLDNTVDFGIEKQTFAGWAWSFVPSILPVAPDDPINEEQCAKLGHTLHIGFYVDNASLTFKVCESSNEKGTYYSQKKIRYWPLMTFRLQGIFSDTIMHSKHWTQVSMGISQMLLIPIGHCSCSIQDVFEEGPSVEYLSAGSVSEVHKSLSLFDVEAPENKSQRKNYITNWDHHIETNSEATLLERSPAFAIDYLYQLSVPDDMTSENLSELGSDLEYSNLSEKALLRVVVGPMRLRVCSGFLHRISSIQAAAQAYDYVPYSIPKPEPNLCDLPPPSEDDFEALNENIPTREVVITIVSPVIELQLMDHPYFKATKGHLFNKRTKTFLQPLQASVELPKVTLQCQNIKVKMKNPMYYKRLVRTTCQLPEPPKHMFEACYSELMVEVIGFCSKLLVSKRQNTILTPTSCKFQSRKILIPEYWINPNIPHEITTLESEGISLTGTNPKFVIFAHIIDKIMKMDCEESINYIVNSSILQDAVKNNGLVYLEFCIEDIFFKKVITASTITYNTRLGSIKAFILEPTEVTYSKSETLLQLIKSSSNTNVYSPREIQQVLIISGPEADIKDPISLSKDQALFTATLQFPISPEKQSHPPILLFNMKEIRVCIDPLLCKWLLYTPRNVPSKTEVLYEAVQRKLSRSYSELSAFETPRKNRTPRESIHSSLEHSTFVAPKETVNQEKHNDEVDFQERVYCFLKNWLDVWKGLLVCGDIAPCTIYFPVKSLSALGAQGIQSALEEELKKEFSSDIFIITLPSVKIRNSAQKENLAKYTSTLPVVLPDHIWTKNKCSFPWSIEVSNFSCFTWQNSEKLICLTPVFLNSTVDMSTKTSKSDIKDIYDMSEHSNFINFTKDKEDIETLGICIHIDMKPIVLKISEVQVCLIASILHGLVEVISNITPDCSCQQEIYKPKPTPAAPQDSTVSPSLLKESLDTMSEKSPHLCTDDLENENIKLTAWIQWTIQRFSIELRAFDTKDLEVQRLKYNNNPNLKFVVDAEDIVSSLDFQSVYLKLKSKIGSVSIMHYIKDKKGKWSPGDFLGLVMRINEESLNSHVPEDTSFANITVTRASCQHTHTLWGKAKKSKTADTVLKKEIQIPSRYITEIVVKLQPIDILMSPTTLKNYFLVLEPLFQIPGLPKKSKKEATTTLQINNRTLPLTYLEFNGFRVIMPSVNLQNQDSIHDTIIFEIKQINLAPTAVNPICRTPCRPDIYQRAAQARILNVPGSELEDRQYQLDILEVSLNTGTWSEIKEMIIFQGKTAYGIRTMSENPALEWNSLGKAKLGCPEITFWPLIQNFNIIAVAAPAIIYKTDVICGHSLEVNFTSNIKISLSLSQIKLFSGLIKESSYVIDVFTTKQGEQKIKVMVPYPQYYPELTLYEENFDGFDLTRDSGFETSDLRSTTHSTKTKDSLNLRKMSDVSERTTVNSETRSNLFTNLGSNQIPVDILITAGNISLALYEYDINQENQLVSPRSNYDVESERGYDASEEGSSDERILIKQFSPLVFLLLAQPNVYFCDSSAGQKFNASCFDLLVKINKIKKHSKGIPNEEDFCICLLETKSGAPDLDTGVFPAFCTLKWFKEAGKSSVLDLDISKPTKVVFTISRYNYLLHVKEKILETLQIKSSKEIKLQPKEFNSLQAFTPKPGTYYSKFNEIKNQLMGVSVCNVNISQIVLTLQSDKGVEMTISFSKLSNKMSISNRPEKIINTLTMEGITLGILKENESKLILNPWSFYTELTLFWETWQSPRSNPQVLLTVESKCLILDISPDTILSLQILLNEITEFCNNLSKSECPKTKISDIKTNFNDREQYYKDDLRAGAFQFVDSSSNNIDELPSPYQVMFWNRKVPAMAWRYPQPRALRKIKVYPVPFKISTEDEEDQQILCYLEYWSDCHKCYQSYTQFFLSETATYHLDLPKHVPQPAVACIWRVVLTAPSINELYQPRGLISPRVLAGCLRVDSYFNKNLIPDLSVTLNIGSINVNIFNYFKYKSDINLPEIIKDYTVDVSIPEYQQVATLTAENMIAYLATWNSKGLIINVTTTSKCTILDYAFLTNHLLIKPFSSKVEIALFNSCSLNYISQPIIVHFGASAAHTLSVTAQLWNEHLNENTVQNLIVITRYLICNNTNVNIIFGQANIEEILLPSRHCHLYAWRSQKCKRVLQLALEKKHWELSEQFQIDNDGTEVYNMQNCSSAIIVTVKSISATQKQIIFSGQFIICNALVEYFEMKVIEAVETEREKEFKSAQVHILRGKTTLPSMLFDLRKKYFLRLRFYGLDSAWSGDIPIMENNKCAQPWLVKVPLQERGQFLSIWCRIVVQNYSKGNKILAVLWPLFMIRSHLPVSAKVHIETAMLKVNVDTLVHGLGEYQQLYCPGTIDQTHQLTFQLEKAPISSPFVPLNYSLVDQKLFFKKSDFEDIDSVLSVINSYDNNYWPYFKEETKDLELLIEDQPLAHVQVRYKNVCQYSSSLMVELLPWALLLNTLGCPIGIISDKKEICRIKHLGLITPPKLEEPFYFTIGIEDMWSISPPLQLAKSNWSQTFYMPLINGSIPLEGSIKTVVKSELNVSALSIISSILNEIRLIKVGSTHVITNHTKLQIQVMSFVVPETQSDIPFREQFEVLSFALQPHMNKRNIGVPIMKWYNLFNKNDEECELAFYISLSTSKQMKWSCPVRVDKYVPRRTTTIQTDDYKNIPLVVVSQEYKGQIFLSIHHDLHPQLKVYNNTHTKLYLGQSNGNSNAVKEVEHFRYFFNVESGKSAYYTMPIVSEKYPELQQVNYAEYLVLSDADRCGDFNNIFWSVPINVTNFNEQFVNIPYLGDIKVTVKFSIHSIQLYIDPISHVEVRAKDIRGRLKILEKEPITTNKEVSADVKEDKAITRGISYSNDDDSTTSTSDSLQFNQFTPFCDFEKSNIFTKDKDNTSKPKESCALRVMVFIKGITLILTSDLKNGGVEKKEVLSVNCDGISLAMTKDEISHFCLGINELQIDNQLYSKGSYDFPVILIGQESKPNIVQNMFSVPVLQLVREAQKECLIKVEITFETWGDNILEETFTEVRDININVNPLSIFIEDGFVMKLLGYVNVLNPSKLVIWPEVVDKRKQNPNQTIICIPEHLILASSMMAKPLVVKEYTIQPINILLSVHSSIKMYIALDQSPLQFGQFDKQRVFTTNYRLGHALAMHYLSGAIFGAGWVVGSLELLGSPGGLARAMGTGLRDFVTLPYYGFIQGPWAFLRGISYGSASLMKHVTAGTLHSVTKLASSVARNLDRLTLDEEHLKRAEESRRERPQGITQGLKQGLTSLGISLLGAVGGIAHHPLQSVMAEGASPFGLVAGVGKGIVGVFTKPLSGAAELLALTGQGLLQGAGWTNLPEPRMNPMVNHIYLKSNADLKYSWKFISKVTQSKILLVTEAAALTSTDEPDPITLVLATDVLVIVDVEGDILKRVLSLSELTGVSKSDPSLLCLKLDAPKIPSQANEDEVIEMDPACRARVVDYVRNTVGLLQLTDNLTSEHSEMSISPNISPRASPNGGNYEETYLSFHMNPLYRNYFLELLSLAKQQNFNHNFPVL